MGQLHDHAPDHEKVVSEDHCSLKMIVNTIIVLEKVLWYENVKMILELQSSIGSKLFENVENC